MLQLEIIGNIGQDAIIKEINGKSYVSFSVAHSGKSGDRETTTWVSVLSYGNGGNLIKYLKPGAKVFVRGKLNVDIYTSKKTGQADAKLSVMASEIQICRFPDELSRGPSDNLPERNQINDNGFNGQDNDMPDFLR